MNYFSVHAQSLVALQNELGGACPSFTWQGKTIRILPGTLKLKALDATGGLSLDSDFACTAILADFGPAAPVSNQAILYQGKKLKLVGVHVAAGGLQVHLEANDAAQRL